MFNPAQAKQLESAPSQLVEVRDVPRENPGKSESGATDRIYIIKRSRPHVKVTAQGIVRLSYDFEGIEKEDPHDKDSPVYVEVYKVSETPAFNAIITKPAVAVKEVAVKQVAKK